MDSPNNEIAPYFRIPAIGILLLNSDFRKTVSIHCVCVWGAISGKWRVALNLLVLVLKIGGVEFGIPAPSTTLFPLNGLWNGKPHIAPKIPHAFYGVRWGCIFQLFDPHVESGITTATPKWDIISWRRMRIIYDTYGYRLFYIGCLAYRVSGHSLRGNVPNGFPVRHFCNWTNSVVCRSLYLMGVDGPR